VNCCLSAVPVRPSPSLDALLVVSAPSRCKPLLPPLPSPPLPVCPLPCDNPHHNHTATHPHHHHRTTLDTPSHSQLALAPIAVSSLPSAACAHDSPASYPVCRRRFHEPSLLKTTTPARQHPPRRRSLAAASPPHSPWPTDHNARASSTSAHTPSTLPNSPTRTSATTPTPA